MTLRRIDQAGVTAVFLCVVLAAWPSTTGVRLSRAATNGSETVAETWTNYTNGNSVNSVAIDPFTADVWVGTWGGVVHWSPSTRSYQKFTSADGLAGNMIQAMAVDSTTGDKWFGTLGSGVSRLAADGHWTTFTYADGLANNWVQAIAIDTATGDKWFGTLFAGVSRLAADGRWSTFTTADGLASPLVTAIAIDTTGGKWFGSKYGGVSRLAADGRWSTFTAADGLASNWVQAIAVDTATGDTWFGTHSGSSRLAADGRWSTFTTADGLANNDIRAIAIDPATGDKWFGTVKDGVSRLAPAGRWTTFTTSDGLADNDVRAIAIDAATGSGEAWFATGNGVGRRTADGRWSTLTTRDALTNMGVNWVRAVAIDAASGDKWFGMEGAGVSRLAADGRWSTFTTADGLASNWVRAIAIDPATGDRWFATNGGGVSRLAANGHWTSFSILAGLDYNDAQAIVIDAASGDKWFGTAKNGVSRLAADGRWTTFTTGDGLADNDVRAIAIDATTGDKWFGTAGGGASRLAADGRWVTFTTANGLAHNAVAAIAIDRATGDKWFGTDSGASRLAADGRWATFTTADGLANNQVEAIAIDAATGDRWFGTNQGSDVSRLAADGRWSTFTTAGGGVDNDVYAIAIDAATGDKWFGTDGGVAVLSNRAARNATCATAVPITPAQAIVADLTTLADIHVFRFEVTAPFSQVQAAIPDPDNRVAVAIFRRCATSAGPPTGRYIGASTGRHVGGVQVAELNVGFNTGTYYVAVYSRAGADQLPLQYHVQLSLSSPDLYDTQTIILTHVEKVADLWGLAGDSPEVVAWRDSLQALADRREVGGIVVGNVQTDTDEAVAAAYWRWVDDPTVVSRANTVAHALRRWIDRVIEVLPNIRYVVIAGDDRVIPSLRLPIEGGADLDSGWMRERTYGASAGIDPRSTVGSALGIESTLTDDVYSVAGPTWWGAGQDVYIPDLAVGRLVERPGDMRAAINAYLCFKDEATGYPTGELRVQHALTAGYDFMQDAVEAADGALAAAGLPMGQRTRLWGDALNPGSLVQQLFRTRQDLAFLGVHASHYLFELPLHQPVGADAVASATADLSGMLAVGLAGHAGLNVPGDAQSNPDGHSNPTDFPEMWQRRSATWIASTGWAYGLDRFLAYQEDLTADVVDRLMAPDGRRVGDALVAAKRDYARRYTLNAMHVKTLAGTVLYGLPMLHVRAAPGGRVSSTQPPGTRSAAHDASPLVASQPMQVNRDVISMTVRTQFGGLLQRMDESDGSHFTLSGYRPLAEAGEPVQPKMTTATAPITLDGQMSFDPRGAVLTSAKYHDELAFQPLVQRAGVIAPLPPGTVSAPRFAAPGWYPRLPIDMRQLAPRGGLRADLAAGRANLLFYVGQFNSATRTERLFDEMVVDEYYSASPDRIGPAVAILDARRHDNTLDLRLTATDASGVYQVVAAYSTGDGTWRSATFGGMGDQWSVSIPLPQTYMVQVVDRAGNVTRLDDQGYVDRPCAELCGPAAPGLRVYLPRLHNR